MKIIYLMPKEIQEMKALYAKGLKIDAIKLIRSAAFHQKTEFDHITQSSTRYSTIGLKEAKDAFEHFFYLESGVINPTAKIQSINPIKSIKVDFGNGEVEVDMEEMLFKFSTSVNFLGIEQTARLIKLYSLIEEWSNSLD